MLRYPQNPRQLLLLGCVTLAVGLCVPASIWLLALVFTPQIQTPPEIVRVRRTADNWEPPALKTDYEIYQAAVFTIPETVAPTSTVAMSATLPKVTSVPTSTGAAMVMSEELYLRDGPGTNYVAVDVLGYGRSLKIVGKHNNWYQVITEQRVIGWVEHSWLSTITPSEQIPNVHDIPNPAPALVASLETGIPGANLRPLPSLDTTPLRVLRPGETAEVTLMLRFDSWFQVQTLDGTIGWLSNELLATNDYIVRRVPLLTSAPQALEAVRMARQFIGYPYVWGAESPQVGFDCSGLVKYIYGRLGVSLPRNSASQWNANFGRRIYDPALMLPGDVIFFENTYKPGVSHVGIYAGNGLIIQAISESVGIQVSSLSEPYWSSRLVGAIRPFQ